MSEGPAPVAATEPVAVSNTTSSELVEDVLPTQFIIKSVPFITQAPNKIWDARHEDACEEASLLTLRYWLAARQPTAAEIEVELQSFITWQTDQGYGPSVTLTELSQAARDYWSEPWWGELTVVSGADLDDLRREIAAGHPVVIGAAGKLLDNPHFKNGGPNYHMLVLIGYDGSEFVTNDPGTQYGASYRYPATVIDAAWHDWNATDITLGGRNYLVAK